MIERTRFETLKIQHVVSTWYTFPGGKAFVELEKLFRTKLDSIFAKTIIRHEEEMFALMLYRINVKPSNFRGNPSRRKVPEISGFLVPLRI